MKKLMFAAAVAAVCVVFGQAPAGAPRMVGPRGGMHAIDSVVRMASNPKFAEQVGLTAEQKAKIEELQKLQRDEVKKLGEAMRVASTKKADMLNAAKVDEAAVMAAIDEVCEVRKQMEKAQAKKIIAVKNVLTPEQLEKAFAAMKELRGPAGARRPRPTKGPKPAIETAPAENPVPAPEKK